MPGCVLLPDDGVAYALPVCDTAPHGLSLSCPSGFFFSLSNSLTAPPPPPIDLTETEGQARAQTRGAEGKRQGNSTPACPPALASSAPNHTFEVVNMAKEPQKRRRTANPYPPLPPSVCGEAKEQKRQCVHAGWVDKRGQPGVSSHGREPEGIRWRMRTGRRGRDGGARTIRRARSASAAQPAWSRRHRAAACSSVVGSGGADAPSEDAAERGVVDEERDAPPEPDDATDRAGERNGAAGAGVFAAACVREMGESESERARERSLSERLPRRERAGCFPKNTAFQPSYAA